MGSWGERVIKRNKMIGVRRIALFVGWDCFVCFLLWAEATACSLGDGTGRKEGLLRLCCRGRVELSYLIRRLEIRDRMVDLENFTWLWDICTQLLL